MINFIYPNVTLTYVTNPKRTCVFGVIRNRKSVGLISGNVAA